MQTYLDAITWEALGSGRYKHTIGGEWFQGRGAFGGIVAASLLRAIEIENPDKSRTPRTLTIHFCAPLADRPAEIVVTLERAGTSITHFRAVLWQDGKPAALASAVFAKKREVDFQRRDLKPRPCPPPEDIPPAPADLPIAPAFTRLFEYRYGIGSLPLAGASEALIGGWCRLRHAVPLDYPLAAAFLDIWPPAIFACFETPRASATVTLHCHFLCDLPLVGLDPERPLLGYAETSLASEGYAEESNFLFTEQGQPLARAEQWIAILS